MENNFNSLVEFINILERNRMMAADTATGYRVALNLVAQELNEDEKRSLTIFKERIEGILSSVVSKNKTKLSLETLKRYMSRVRKVVEDFDKYGDDPAKMASVRRESRSITKGVKSASKQDKGQPIENIEVVESNLNVARETSITRFEFSLRPGIKAVILTPSDLTKSEAKKLRAYIDYLETTATEES